MIKVLKPVKFVQWLDDVVVQPFSIPVDAYECDFRGVAQGQTIVQQVIYTCNAATPEKLQDEFRRNVCFKISVMNQPPTVVPALLAEYSLVKLQPLLDFLRTAHEGDADQGLTLREKLAVLWQLKVPFFMRPEEVWRIRICGHEIYNEPRHMLPPVSGTLLLLGVSSHDVAS